MDLLNDASLDSADQATTASKKRVRVSSEEIESVLFLGQVDSVPAAHHGGSISSSSQATRPIKRVRITATKH